jgi:hypothetical protein
MLGRDLTNDSMFVACHLTPFPVNQKFGLMVVEVGTVAETGRSVLVNPVLRPLKKVAHVERPAVAAPHWPLLAPVMAHRQMHEEGRSTVI